MTTMPDRFDTSFVDATHKSLTGNLEQIRRTTVTSDAGLSSSEKARISRLLLHTSHLAEALASEVQTLYWEFKGEDDPRW